MPQVDLVNYFVLAFCLINSYIIFYCFITINNLASFFIKYTFLNRLKFRILFLFNKYLNIY